MVLDTTKADWVNLGISTEDMRVRDRYTVVNAEEDEVPNEALANMMDQSTPSPTKEI